MGLFLACSISRAQELFLKTGQHEIKIEMLKYDKNDRLWSLTTVESLHIDVRWVKDQGVLLMRKKKSKIEQY